MKDAIARRWLHALPPDLPVALVFTLQRNSVWGSYATGIHGGPYDYDAHVPVIFYGPAFRPGRYDQFARVVDMAPTLARVIGVAPTERLDGRVLNDALKDSAGPQRERHGDDVSHRVGASRHSARVGSSLRRASTQPL